MASLRSGCRTSSSAPISRAAHGLQRAHYSPLPVRPISRNRKSSNRGNQLKKVEDHPELTPSASSAWNNWSPSSLWNPSNGRSPANDASFPWTDYETKAPLTRTTNVPSHVPQRTPRSSSTSSIIVHVPDTQNGVLTANHPAAALLQQSALVIVRQLEMMNLFIGFEQANRYRILSPTGETLGFLAEEERGFTGTIFRQIAGTHRSFIATIFDVNGIEILRIRRPFSLINSRIFIQLCDSRDPTNQEERLLIGESQQEFHLWRRRYNLFTRLASSSSSPSEEPEYEQFARIDAGFLSWDFFTLDDKGRSTGSISKNFTGFGREIFTDTGQYVVRFDAVEAHQQPIQDSSSPTHTGLTLDQRAVILATAVSIDFDYFSRSHRGGLMPPIFFGGGSSSDDF
ncbi:hypothetical protein MJO28_008033 [Puccinia striiformis f. sp. tritici]|uniref:Uncharacterized protein n=1 Tax=Puccinia striiformis f. sp. tritici TaxID=168172 RepID=A0ACC0EBJ4_9BASI|nr:hypothetical protein MJO28_008033 [Puccinia striiformis f. sp. tritici]